MARTEIANQSADSTGAELTFGPVDATAAPDGNYFQFDGSAVLLITNGDVAPHTMTVDVPVEVDGVEVDDRTVTIPAGETWMWKPNTVHRQGDGTVHLNWDADTSMTVALINT